MIDWITGIVPYPHDDYICGGALLGTDNTGSLEWEVFKKLPVQGSFDSQFCLKSNGHPKDVKQTHLYFSGNPSKFLQGHNVFGSDDLCYLLIWAIKKALSAIDLPVDLFTWNRWFKGDFVLKRVDIAQSFKLDSREDVRAFIRALSHTGIMRNRGRGQFRGDTLYYGKHSKRWAIKVYSKGDEIQKGGKKHNLPNSITKVYPVIADNLEKTYDGALRIELVLRSLELERLGLSQGKYWPTLYVKHLWQLHWDKVEMTDNIVKDIAAHTLSKALQRTYFIWKDGQDCRSMMTHSTFYLHRSKLKKYGIDIAQTQVMEHENVTPFIRRLEALPMGIPSWAIDTEFYHESPKEKANRIT